jgi:hypothetical protein
MHTISQTRLATSEPPFDRASLRCHDGYGAVVLAMADKSHRATLRQFSSIHASLSAGLSYLDVCLALEPSACVCRCRSV